MNAPVANGSARLNRRRFLRAAATAAAAPLLLPSWGRAAPSARLTIGMLGLGGRGFDHLRGLLGRDDVQVVAACDAYRSKAEAAARAVEARYGAQTASGAHRGCQVTQDFREVLARPDVDAVVIASPEHWHAIMDVEALKAGKDVYGEKALALTVAEGRAVCEAVRRHGRVFQAGTQQRSDERFRFACELARNGHLGKLHTVTVAVPGGNSLPVLPVRPPPPDLHYDLWLGPSPRAPHREGLCVYNWYFVTDYCAGWIQSWGVHHLDTALWGAPALAEAPLAIEGTATFPAEGTGDTSFAWNVRCTAPSGLVMNYHSDGTSPHGHGVRFEGDRGWVHVTRESLRASSPDLLATPLRPTDTRLPVSRDHMSNFLECVRSRREPVAPAGACQRATALSLAADIATRTGRRLTWDAAREQFVNDAEANRRLARAFRSPWRV